MTTLKDLTPGDIGKPIRVLGENLDIRGTLEHFAPEVSWVYDGTWDDLGSKVPGRITMSLEVGGFRGSGIPLDTTIIFL